MIEVYEVHAPKTLELVSSAVELSSPISICASAPELGQGLKMSASITQSWKKLKIIAITYLSKYRPWDGML